VGFMILLDGMVTHQSRRPLTKSSVNESVQVATVNQVSSANHAGPQFFRQIA